MTDCTAMRIDDMDAIYGRGFVKARASLGVTSFGLQVLEIPAGFDGYPNHDHAEEGQEEVYVALRGSATLTVEGEDHVLDPETMIRVGPAAKRKITPGPDGIRMLVMGAVPGKPYEIRPGTEIGAPAPPLGQPVAR